MASDKPVLEVNLGQTKDQLNIKSKWWTDTEENAYNSVFSVVNAIEQNQQYRPIQNLKYARLYSNQEALGFYGSLFSRTANSTTPLLNNRVTLNVIKACIDTASSKIAKNKPRPVFLTSDGDWSLKRRAKKLTKYIDGAFDHAGVYQVAQDIFKDAGVFGTGVMKIYVQNGTVCVERVLTDEIIVDDAEGMYGTPRQLHQRKYIHREVLLEMFPEHAQKIMGATSGVKGDNSSTTTSELIKVIESWHLKSGPDAKDGKHIISIENCTLFSEEYKKDYFPFVFFRPSKRLVGFFGMGFAEELIGLQIEINRILRTIQQALHLVAKPRVFVEASSNVNTNHINNDVGGVVKYSGIAPIVVPTPGVAPEVYQHLENLYKKAFEIVGISQLSATAKKPGGLNSGVALREYNDIESERFAIMGQQWEEMFLDIARIFIDLTRDLYAEDKDLAVKGKSNKFIESIRWADVCLDEDQYSMRVFPASILPTTPAGRLERVTELIQAGFIQKEQALSLLDFPDLESFTSLQNAAIDDIEMCHEKMIEEGEYISPEPYMNLQLALTMTQSAYLKAKVDGVPEERLELLRAFISDVQTLITAATPEPSPAPEMDPMANPQAAPKSDILPVQ